MPTIKNVSPIGDIDVPLLRRIVGRDQQVEVTDQQAEILLQQTENWASVVESGEAA